MDSADHTWQHDIHRVLRARDVRQVAYVPDAGHAGLIRACEADPYITASVLTTEEEGIALLSGAWLGGQAGALLMQSSGVGNCINMLSLAATCRFPLLMLVTMRGEWGEFNPWQIPMGQAVPDILARAGVDVYRADKAADVGDTVAGAAGIAFDGERMVAVLLGQRLIGAKKWTAGEAAGE